MESEQEEHQEQEQQEQEQQEQQHEEEEQQEEGKIHALVFDLKEQQEEGKIHALEEQHEQEEEQEEQDKIHALVFRKIRDLNAVCEGKLKGAHFDLDLAGSLSSDEGGTGVDWGELAGGGGEGAKRASQGMWWCVRCA
jgi:hypothetical protein